MISYGVPTSFVFNTCDYGTVIHFSLRRELPKAGRRVLVQTVG
jgi:hypothetical protein